MNHNFKLLIGSGAMLVGAVCAQAAPPQILSVPSGVVINRLSDNGLWGISQSSVETDAGEVYASGGSIWNIETMKATGVNLPASGHAALNDVSDDGNIIVGSAGEVPAYYDVATGHWHRLPLPQGSTLGGLIAVTADGKKAVGYANVESEWDATPVFYDLETSTLIELTGLPTHNMNHDRAALHRFSDISGDGRYIVGKLSEEILMPVSMCTYVYDTTDGSVRYVGFTPHDTRAWTPAAKDLYFIDGTAMSGNGRYITGGSYVAREVEGQYAMDEYYTAFSYDVAADSFTLFDGPYDSDVQGMCIADDGTTFVTVPAQNPYASMAVRHGNYYYPLDEILSQVYDIDFTALGRSNTGKPISCSADGKTLVLLTDPSVCYILKVTDDWADVCPQVNLLSSYSVSPASGSVFSTLSTLTVTFSRNIDINGAASRIKLTDADGKTLASALSAEVKDATLTVNFRPVSLEAGKVYNVTIPNGFISMTGDANVSAGAIKIAYTGRRDGAVSTVAVQPADGSSFSRLDASTNCIFVSFDAAIALTPEAKVTLQRLGENPATTDLNMALYNASTVAIYPSARQYLYDGTDYQVVIAAGSVTDLSGAGANEAITLNYKGNYIREVSADDKYIFSDNCSNYDGFMFYDGDQLTPGTVASGWGFTAAVPWYIIRESNESTDMAFGAHSMYSPAGKADDWCVTPQLFIPDADCYLTFDAQSYLKSKTDSLKVYVLPCEDGYSTLSASFVDKIRTEGTLVFAEQLTPGASEEDLSGDWVNYVVNLPQFAGKSVYIAFVNDNENQSAVFIDNVAVVHDMQFLTTITSPMALVQAESAPIGGILTFTSDILTVNKIEMTLKDADKNVVDALTYEGLDLRKGQTFAFSFAQPLPLKAGTTTRYTIEVSINGGTPTTLNFSAKNLAFAPTRRVVVEEYSGRDCSNCPLGFSAMANLEKLYPGQIIPIVLRTYESDPLGTGMEGYTSFLGINNLGAPSAMIDRTYACYPALSVGSDFMFSGEGIFDEAGNEQMCWLDAVNAVMANDADADVEFTADFDPESEQIFIKGAAKFALTGSKNVTLFSVVLEDECPTTQLNGMRYYEDPDLGEWGKGGALAEREVEIEIDAVGRGAYGTTYNGTAGLIPTVQTAGTEYAFDYSVGMPQTVSNVENTRFVIMMIDSDNDRVINANVVPVNIGEASIDEIEAGSEAPAAFYNLQGIRVNAPSKGQLLIKRQGSKASKIIF